MVALVDAGSNPFELGCATEVFGLRRPELGRDLYDFRLCSATRTTRMRDGFFDLTGIAPLDAIDEADTVIVPNRPDVEVPRRPVVLDAIRRAHARGARLIGFCSGAFTLAEAGFRAELGTTPLAWLTGERVALACRLLERGETRPDVVARRSGLGTAANLRALLRRETGLTPTEYHRRFGREPD